MFAGIERFFIEFIRMNPKYLFNLSGAQLISLGMISISIWFFYFKKKESPVS
jgi:prolipoprotein diacylglyceryltransferase